MAEEIDNSGQTQWSRSNFTNTFKRKARKNRGSDTASNASAGKSERRMSVDRAMEKVATSLGGERRDSKDSSTRKLSKILPGKRRNKKENYANDEDPLSRSTTGDDGPTSLYSSTVASDEGALPLATSDSGNFTEDSESESRPPPVRPTLSAHNSHTGYLTLSSPLITAETVASTAPPLQSVESLSDALNKSQSNSLKAPTSAAQRRSPSPVGRLKEAFKPAKKNAAKPESESSRSQSNGGAAGALGGLLAKEAGRGRKSSITSRSDSKVLEEQPLFQEPGEQTPSPKKALSARPIITSPATPPPAALNGPATVVTPPTPTDSPHRRLPSTPTAGDRSIADTVADKGTSSESDTPTARTLGPGHRRGKSSTNHPSKLSSSMSVPLTPAPEEVKSPGGTLSSPQSPGGFFSSMFSAAQNAANSISTTIASGTSGPRSRSGTGDSNGQDGVGGEEVILAPGSERQLGTTAGERRQLAIETLGSGDLSLSHLGISESSDPSPMTSKQDLGGLRKDEISAQAEDDAAARAVSIAYSEQQTGEKTPSLAPSQEAPQHEQTPIRAPAEPDTSSIKRAGSVRSRLSGRRRTRGSSAATGTVITPIITGPGGSTAQRLTGFAVANPKRNRDFHNLFRSVPEDDYLIEDYSAALQREILLHGRLYISEGHLCFSSNILGWVTNLVMSFDEIISVEKRSTAVIFQNGLVIQTLQARNIFASLLNRDSTYELIISIWKITHPNLTSSLNGAPIEGAGTGDKTEKAGSVVEDESASEEIYDEDEEDEDDEGDDSFIEANEGSNMGSDMGDASTVIRNKTSIASVAPPLSNGNAKIVDIVDTAIAGAAATQDFPGPSTHDATDCGDHDKHLERLLLDVNIPAPLGKIYSMMFGPASGTFMRKWLIEDQKSMDLQLEDDKEGLGEKKKTMSFSYIKPLSGSIGPKQTKCIINQTLEQFDLDKAVTVACSTQNPDVPSGNIFVVKTRYCLMWAPGNATRLISTCAIEWSGKSWLKGPIEKGANDGQMQYQKDISAALRAAVTVKPLLKGLRGKGKAGRRKKDSADLANDSKGDGTNSFSAANRASEPNWGLLEPLRGPLGPVATLVSPSLTIGILSFLVLFLWWRGGRAAGSTGNLGVPGLATSQRIAAYEEMWRGEESELWRWLEDRVGLDGAIPAFLNQAPDKEEKKKKKRKDWLSRQKAIEMEKKIVNEDMGERQMLEAIRVTKERLKTLEDAVNRRKKGDPVADGDPPPKYTEKE